MSHDASSQLTPQQLVKRIEDLQAEDPDTPYRDILKRVFREMRTDFNRYPFFEYIGKIKHETEDMEDKKIILYHGTSKELATLIKEEGLKPLVGPKTLEWWDNDPKWREFAEISGIDYYENKLYTKKELEDLLDKYNNKIEDPDYISRYLNDISFVVTTNKELAKNYAEHHKDPEVLQIEINKDTWDNLGKQKDKTDPDIWEGKKQKSYQIFESIPSRFIKLKELNNGQGKGWWGESERHSKAKKTGHADLFQYHAVILDFIEDLNHNPSYALDFLTLDSRGGAREGSGRPRKQGRKKQAPLSTWKKAMGTKTFQDVPPPQVAQPFTIPEIPTIPGLTDRPMESVQSSMVKGVGAYKGHLLVEYQFDPGNIWGYPVGGEQAGNFFNEILLSGSKGGWIWDNLLGKPSQYGMAKGKFYTWNENGEQIFRTSKGAQFVHPLGRPVKFTYNPVGYRTSQQEYNQSAETEKAFKESVVRPPESRNPISGSLLQQQQGKRRNTMNEIRELLKGAGIKADFVGNLKLDIVKIVDKSGAEHKENIVKLIGPTTKSDKAYLVYYDNEGNVDETIELDVDRIIEFADAIKKRELRKGKGWWGESERHSKAKKTGKADLVEDLQENELDIWIAKKDLNTFLEDFEKLNDVKIDTIETISKDEEDRRYSIQYRNFGKKIKTPPQTYYQLNNHWITGELEKKGSGKGWFGESERHSEAAKKGKHDFEVIEDATRRQAGAENLDKARYEKQQRQNSVYEKMKKKDMKREDTETWERLKKNYPNKEYYVTKAGRGYIKATSITSKNYNPFGQTEKAIRYGETWIPKSHAFVKKSYAGGGENKYELFISEQFFGKYGDAKEQEEYSKELEALASTISRLNYAKEKDKFTSITPEQKAKDIQYYTNEYKESLAELRKMGKRIGEENVLKGIEKYKTKVDKKRAEIEKLRSDPDSEGWIKQEERELAPFERVLGKIQRKGKGWWGESERHSEAAKKGNSLKSMKHDGLEYIGNLITDTTISVRETKNYTRKRQIEPSECEKGTYRTFKIGKGKKAVGCMVNGKFKVQSILEPKGDLEYIGNIFDSESSCISEGFKKYENDPKFQAKTRDQKLGFLYGICRSKQDLVPLSEFKRIKHDFQEDFVVFRGPIARSGPYVYMDENGNRTTLYKDWNNLKDIYSKYDHLPLKVAKDLAHYADLEGFGYEFTPNEKTEEIDATLVLVNDKKFGKIDYKDYHVSPGYNDKILPNNVQLIKDLDHIALSLGKERARACSGVNSKGASCTTVKPVHDQNLNIKEVMSNH